MSKLRLAMTTTTGAVLVTGALVGAVPAQAASPVVGQCLTYNRTDATKALSPAAAVDCAGPHTAETFYVGTAKGGFARPSKATAPQLLAESGPCTENRMNTYIGNSERTLPSRFLPVLMLPTDAQWQAGERWMRCDVVLQGGTQLARTTGTAAALVAANPPTQFDFCTLGEPNARNTAAYPCNKAKKNWIKVLDQDLGGPGSRFPGSSVENRTRHLCEKQGKKWDAGQKWPGWWAIWPTSVGWKEGRRSAQCFVPYQQYLKELASHKPKPTPVASPSPAASPSSSPSSTPITDPTPTPAP